MHGPQYQVEERHGVKVLKVSGHIDAISFGDLASMIVRTITEATPYLVLDCQAVRYIESAQLKHLSELAQTARNLGGDLLCTGFSPAIESVALIVNADNSLRCFRDLPEAVATLEQCAVSATA